MSLPIARARKNLARGTWLRPRNPPTLPSGPVALVRSFESAFDFFVLGTGPRARNSGTPCIVNRPALNAISSKPSPISCPCLPPPRVTQQLAYAIYSRQKTPFGLLQQPVLPNFGFSSI